MGSRQTHGKEELASSHRKVYRIGSLRYIINNIVHSVFQSYPGSSGRGRKLSQRRSESMDEGHRQVSGQGYVEVGGAQCR